MSYGFKEDAIWEATTEEKINAILFILLKAEPVVNYDISTCPEKFRKFMEEKKPQFIAYGDVE